MAFVSTFENALRSINDKVQKDVKLKKLLEQYNGRSITLDITGDRIHMIKMFKDCKARIIF